MDEVKELYFANATLYLEEEDKEMFNESKPEFLKFLEQDQRFILKEMNSPAEKCKRMIRMLTEVRNKRMAQMAEERDLEFNNSKISRTNSADTEA